MAKTSQPDLTPHIVAYLDILGLRKMMVTSAKHPDKAKDILRSYHTSVSEALEILRPSAVKPGISWRHKVFTDNIVLAIPIWSDDVESEFGLAATSVAEFQLRLAVSGWFVRGGMSLGSLYFDDDIVFGPALVEAYDLENQAAQDPRVILSDPVSKLVKTHLKYFGDPYWSPQNGYVFIDVDGCRTINYLYAPVGFDVSRDVNHVNRKQVLGLLREHKGRVEERLDTWAKNPKIWAKYRWVANYHNFFCKIWFPEVKNIRIGGTAFKTEPTLLIRKPR